MNCKYSPQHHFCLALPAVNAHPCEIPSLKSPGLAFYKLGGLSQARSIELPGPVSLVINQGVHRKLPSRHSAAFIKQAPVAWPASECGRLAVVAPRAGSFTAHKLAILVRDNFSAVANLASNMVGHDGGERRHCGAEHGDRSQRRRQSAPAVLCIPPR